MFDYVPCMRWLATPLDGPNFDGSAELQANSYREMHALIKQIHNLHHLSIVPLSGAGENIHLAMNVKEGAPTYLITYADIGGKVIDN